MAAPSILGVTRAQPRIDLGVGDSRDAQGLGQWQPDGGNVANTRWQSEAATTGTSTWNGEEPYWVDVTCYGIEIETYTGHDRAADEWDVGTATIVLANDTGWADWPPTVEPNPFDLTVRPGRQVRVSVAVDPNAMTAGTAYVPGYLTPTVGTVSTADAPELTISGNVRITAKVQFGPNVGTYQPVVDKPNSWMIALWDSYVHPTYVPPGGAPTALYTHDNWPALYPIAADTYFGVELRLNYEGALWHRALISDDGETWSIGGPNPGWVGAYAPLTSFADSPSPMTIGTASATFLHPGRIYWVQAEQLDATGTVTGLVWRFDADDYPGTGTSYTDPRGRTWTLTAAAAITPKVTEILPVPVPGSLRVLWRGWVDQANPGFDAEFGDVVTLECIDAKGEIGRVEVATVDPAVGAGETIQARLNRIADAAVWPDYWRNFEGAGITVVATELGQQAIDLLNRAADSGGGALFGDVDGKLRYRNRDWQLWPADEYEDATIGNVDVGHLDELALTHDPADSYLFDPTGITLTEDPAGSDLYDASGSTPPLVASGSGLFVFGVWVPGDYCPSSWEMAFAREDITTMVLIGRSDMEEPITLIDEEGKDRYGIEPLNLTDLETTLDSELTQIGNRLLVTRGHTTMPRIAGVTINAASHPDNVNLLSTADPRIPSRFRCRHVSGGRAVINGRFMFCTAIRHTIGPDMWEARLSLDDAMPWQVPTDVGFWSDTETSTAGHWQETKWGEDITPS